VAIVLSAISFLPGAKKDAAAITQPVGILSFMKQIASEPIGTPPDQKARKVH